MLRSHQFTQIQLSPQLVGKAPAKSVILGRNYHKKGPRNPGGTAQVLLFVICKSSFTQHVCDRHERLFFSLAVCTDMYHLATKRRCVCVCVCVCVCLWCMCDK